MVSVNMHDINGKVKAWIYDQDDDSNTPHHERTYRIDFENDRGEIHIYLKGLSRAIEVVTKLREDLVKLREKALE